MKAAAVIFFICLPMASLLHRSAGQSCRNETTFSGDRVFANCTTLPYLGASLHWTYNASSASVDIAYRAPQSSSGWVAWAINPTGTGMSGANAFLAFHSGSSVTVYTTQFPSTAIRPSDIKDENLTFPVHSKQAEYTEGFYVIYASLGLPNANPRQNIVWQESTSMVNGVPYSHSFRGGNYLSYTSLDFLSGVAD